MYQVKYRIEYKRLSNSLTTIDILDSAGSGSITYLEPTADPLHISFAGDVNNIYQPTLGSGATLSVYAVPLTLLGLFTADPLKYVVNIYNGDSTTAPVWQGFVNTKIYNEDYSSTDPVAITIQCNDGMQVLDTMYYKKTTDGSLISGVQKVGAILNTVISKLTGLTFNYLYTSNDLTLSGSHNLFERIMVNNDNFVDESGVAVTCREVLNNIIGSLPLVMRFIGEDIYIYDPYNLADINKGYRYTLSDFATSETAITSLGGAIDISTPEDNIRWFETGQALDIVSHVDEVDVNYDPYTLTDFGYDFNEVTNIANAVTYTKVTTPYAYQYNNTVNFLNWTQTGSGHFIAVKETDYSDPTFGIWLTNTGNSLTYTIHNTGLYPDSSLRLLISAEGFAQTKEANCNIFSGAASTPTYGYHIFYSLKVGDQYWKGTGWEAGQTGNWNNNTMMMIQANVSNTAYSHNPTLSLVNDVWTPSIKQSWTLAPNTFLGGSDIEFTIYDTWSSPWVDIKTGCYANFKGIMLKDLKFTLIDYVTGKPIENLGVNTKGNVTTNSAYKSDPVSIDTRLGTGVYGTSKAALTSDFNELNNIELVTGLIRTGDNTPHNTSNLILQSYLSQYKLPRLKLSGVLDAKNYMNRLPLKLIKDSAYLSTIAFYIVSGDYIDVDEAWSVEMVELANTRESI